MRFGGIDIGAKNVARNARRSFRGKDVLSGHAACFVDPLPDSGLRDPANQAEGLLAAATINRAAQGIKGAGAHIHALVNNQSCKLVKEQNIAAPYNHGCRYPGVIRTDRFGAMMRDRGMTQAELARRVGVTQAAIGKLAIGKSSGSRYIHRIAHELGTTPAYLTGEADDPMSDAPDNTYSADERDWIDNMRQLDPKDRAALLQIAKSLSRAPDAPTVHSPAPGYRAG